jgi:uncharacterized glyoxalase superfamily protein PhnB
MSNIKTAPGHQQVIPYLIVEGAALLIDFAKKVFAAEELLKVPKGEGIMHAEIKIGDSVIMLTDATQQFEKAVANLFIYVANADETYLEAINEGATSVMEPSTQPYGRTAGIKDPLGNTWWITSI